MTKPPGAAPAHADRIDLLQTFVRIVEAGSLSAAALQMGASQPTVSRRLQALEQLLGQRLLQRSTHAMRVTEDGERCLEHARELLARWDAFATDLRSDDEAIEGTLRLVVPHAFGQERLVRPLAEFLRQHPRVTVEWSLHDRVLDFIAEGIDCAIQLGEVHDPGMVAIKVADVPRIVVAAPTLIDPRQPPRQAGDLAGLPWLALRTYYRNEVTLTHAGSGISETFAIRTRVSTDSLYALRSAARLGLGVGIASAWLVADDLADGRLVHVLPEWHTAPLPVYLIYPYARYYPARLRRFVAMMRAAVPAAIAAA